jgi:hypothetical protein
VASVPGAETATGPVAAATATPNSISASSELGTDEGFFAAGGPLDAIDEYGNIYVIWQEYSTRTTIWVDVYCQQASGTYCSSKTAGTWVGATELDSSLSADELGPDIAVTQTGLVCAAWASYTVDDVYVDCYYSGAWTALKTFATNTVEDQPAIAFDESGYLVLAYAVPTAADALCVAKLTVTTTITGSCVDFTTTQLGIGNTYSLDSWAITCLLSAATTCAVYYGDGISTTEWGIEVIESSTDFVSGISAGPFTIEEEAWSSSYWGGWFGGKPTLNIQDGGAACSLTTSNCAVAYAYDSGDVESNDYIVHYAYSTDGWATSANIHIGTPPSSTGPISVTAITIVGSSSPIISWNTSLTMYIAGSSTQAGSWGTDWTIACTGSYMCMPGLSEVPNSASYTIGNSIQWKVGISYASASYAYYAYFYGPALTLPTATLTALDVEQSTTISVSIYSGPPIAEGFTITASTGYTWTGLPTGCSSTANSFTCTPTVANTYSVSVYAKDTAGFLSATMDTLTIIVNKALAAGSVTPASPTIDTGQSIALTSTSPTGGTAPLTEQWMAGTSATCSADAAVPGQTGLTYSPSPTSNYDYCVKYGDSSAGAPAAVVYSNVVPVTVNIALSAGSVSASYTTIDTGQSTALTATSPTGGTISYSEQWMSGTSATCSMDALVPGQTGLTYTPYPTSNTYYCVQYGDSSVGSPAASVYSNVVLITVNADPKVSPTASPNPTTIGTPVNLTGGGTGGTSPVYAWHCSDGFTAAVSPVSHAFSSSGIFSCDVWYNDTWYHPAGVVNVTISGSTSILISSLTISSNPVVVLTNVYINVSASGGIGSLLYAYAGLPPGCSTASTFSLTCSPSRTGTFTIRVYVNDSSSHSANKTVTLTVYVMPSISAFTALPDPVEANRTDYLNVTATGGLAWLAYRYTGLPSGCVTSNASAITCAPKYAGTYSIRVYVNDSAGHSKSATANLTVTVSLPTINSFTVGPSVPFVDDTLYLNISATGGVGGLSYAYAGLPSGCISSNTPILTCIPSVTGTFAVMAYANDTASHSASATVSFTIYSLPSITSFAASINPDSVNEITYLNVTVAGGRAPFTFSYSGLPTQCISTSTPSLFCKPSSSGSYTVIVAVVDSNAKTATKALLLTVSPTGITIDTFTASVNPVDVGQSTILDAFVGGGTTPYTYSYSGLPSGCLTTNASSFSCVPAQSGYYNITLTVTDALRNAATKVLFLVVNPPLLLSSVVPTPDPVNENSLVQIAVTASGGKSPYSYSYAGLPPGCLTSNTDDLSCTPTSAGTYAINVTVTDANDMTAYLVASLTVSPVSPTLIITSFTASPSTIELGADTYLNVSATGGTGTLNYYYSGLPAGCSKLDTPTLICKPSVVGTFNITVTVIDTLGRSASRSVTLTVNGSGSSATIFPWWIILVIAAVMVAVSLASIANRRRKIHAVVAETASAPVAVAVAGEGAPLAEQQPQISEAAMLLPSAEEVPIPPEPQVPEEVTPEPTPESGMEPAFGGAEETPFLPPPPPPEEAPPLTNCPQCMGPLTPEKTCENCGVSWVREDAAPAEPPRIELFPSTEPSAEAEQPPQWEMQEPQGETTGGDQYAAPEEAVPPPPEAPSPPPEATPEPTAEPSPEETPETPAVHEFPPVSWPPEPPSAAETPTETHEAPAPAVVETQASPQPERIAPTPAKPVPKSTKRVPATKKCFICGTELEAGYCPTCNMSWEGETPP